MAQPPNYPGYGQPQYPAQYAPQYPQYAYPQKRGMPGWLIGLVIGLVVLLVGGGIAMAVVLNSVTSLPDQSKWVTYRAPDGSFEARFPTEPVSSVDTEHTAFGTVTTHENISTSLGGTFEASYTVYDPMEVEYNLDEVMKGIAEAWHTRVTSNTVVTHQGYPGRQGVLNNGETTILLFLTPGRMWTIAVTGAADHFQFFTSNVKLSATLGE